AGRRDPESLPEPGGRPDRRGARGAAGVRQGPVHPTGSRRPGPGGEHGQEPRPTSVREARRLRPDGGGRRRHAARISPVERRARRDHDAGQLAVAGIHGTSTWATVPDGLALVTLRTPPAASRRTRCEAKPMWPSPRLFSTAPAGIPHPSSAITRWASSPERARLIWTTLARACLTTSLSSSLAAA